MSDKWLVSAGKDKAASIWDSASGKCMLKLDRHTDSIQSAQFSHDDTKVYTIGID